MTQILE